MVFAGTTECWDLRGLVGKSHLEGFMTVVVPALIQYLLEPQGVLKPGIHPLPVEGNSSVRRVAETAKIKSNQTKCCWIR